MKIKVYICPQDFPQRAWRGRPMVDLDYGDHGHLEPIEHPVTTAKIDDVIKRYEAYALPQPAKFVERRKSDRFDRRLPPPVLFTHTKLSKEEIDMLMENSMPGEIQFIPNHAPDFMDGALVPVVGFILVAGACALALHLMGLV